MEQSQTPLLDAMTAMKDRNLTPFDVPGHKRTGGVAQLAHFIGKKALAFDVNSMPMLDNLNYPTGVIAQAQALMADAYGADHAFFTVNGTTSAVHAMLMSVCSPGDEILLPRNVHKSAINALIMCDAMPVYMQAQVSDTLKIATGVTLETVKQSIAEHPRAKAIFLINPTYYGICSQLAEITEYAHSKGLTVLVDEAHGAHFAFSDSLPVHAIACGADMAAVSIHKTGGALTQSSVLLMKEGRVQKSAVQAALNLLQTTSASYLLMTSLDIARHHMVQGGKAMLDRITVCARQARERINAIDGLYAYGKELIGTPGIYDFDETKLGVNVAGLGLTGYEVYDLLLEDCNIQMELADTHNVLGIVSMGDNDQSLNKLVSSLKHIAFRYRRQRREEIPAVPLKNPLVRITPRKAYYAEKTRVPLPEAAGRICAEPVMVYPPGIPILAPGEEITQEITEYLAFLKNQNAKLTDMSDPSLNTIKVIA